jgi:predicted esterase
VSTAVTTLVVLHGYDSSAQRGDELARDLDPEGRFHHVVPEGAIKVESGERAWFEVDAPGSVAAAAHELAAVLTSLVDDAGIDPAEVAVVGYSQGVAAALATLATGIGPRVGRVLAISGFVVDQDGVEYDWSRLCGSRVLIQHGERDDVVPSFFSSDLAAVLSEAGVDVALQSFPIGHERSVASTQAAREWLART